MKILFAHPNFAGQFKHLVRHFAKKSKYEVVFITTHYNKQAPEGVKVIFSKPNTPPKNSNSHQYMNNSAASNRVSEHFELTSFIL